MAQVSPGHEFPTATSMTCSPPPPMTRISGGSFLMVSDRYYPDEVPAGTRPVGSFPHHPEPADRAEYSVETLLG